MARNVSFLVNTYLEKYINGRVGTALNVYVSVPSVKEVKCFRILLWTVVMTIVFIILGAWAYVPLDVLCLRKENYVQSAYNYFEFMMPDSCDMIGIRLFLFEV